MATSLEAIGDLIPLTDEDVKDLCDAMKRKALATDQRVLVNEYLSGRSLTCQQAGILLQTVKLGLMQRKLAFEVLQGRVSDIPDGLHHILDALSGTIRRDVEASFRDPPTDGSIQRTRTRAFLFSNGPDLLLPSNNVAPEVTLVEPLKLDNYPPDRRKPNWQESVETLRSHVVNGDVTVSGPLYEDLVALFEALGLGPLPAPMPQPDDAVPIASGELTASSGAPPVPAAMPNAVPPPNRDPAPAWLGSDSPVHLNKITPDLPAAVPKAKAVRPTSAKSATSEESV